MSAFTKIQRPGILFVGQRDSETRNSKLVPIFELRFSNSAPFGSVSLDVNWFRHWLVAQTGVKESINMNLTVNPIRRLAYSLVGLLGGNAILLFFLLQNAFRLRAMLLADHMGEPARQIPDALQMFVIYAIFA